MSYILEALRKSERERQLKQAPSLAAAVTAEPAPQARPWLPWLMVGVLVLVNGAALSYFLLADRHAAGPVAERPAEAAVPSPPATAANPRPQPSAPALTLPVPPVTARVPPAPAEAPPPPAAESMPVAPPAAEERLAPPRLAPPARLADKAPRVRPAPKPAVPADSEEAEPAEDKPAYRINVLAYGADPRDRFAVINMSRYVKGDRLPDGAVVEEIETDGVLLIRNGRKLRIAH
jgi:general secretion pathway protein B